MEERKKRRAVDLLLKVATECSIAETDLFESSRDHYIEGEYYIFLRRAEKGEYPADEVPDELPNIFGRIDWTESSRKSFNELMRYLLVDCGWASKYSEQSLGELLQRNIVRAHDHGLDRGIALQELEALAQQVEGYSQRQLVCIPLQGIFPPSRAVPIGRMLLASMRSAQFTSLLGREVDSVAVRTEEPELIDSQKVWQLLRQALFDLRHHISRTLLEGLEQDQLVYAVYEVVAEPKCALGLAQAEARVIIDVLRFAKVLLYPHLLRHGLDIAVGIVGEVLTHQQSTIILAPDNGEIEFGDPKVLTLPTLVLSDELFALMRERGLLSLVERHQQKGALTGFEAALLRAIHWYAAAQNHAESENAVLNLTTVLEVFLSPSPNESVSISSSVAEGAAIILRESVDDRIALSKRVKELYRLRSRLTHGEYEAALEEDVSELRDIVTELLDRMLDWRARFQDLASLKAWIDRRKFSGGISG